MVKITEELVRKRAEHNEGLIGTLEELTLHQEDIEKIEHLNNWCRHLQILYLQANLIAKIENLNKLKKLVYLNLAINNIELIENLEGCESLEKLDLTLNFIGNIESVSSLAKNAHLKHLYLTGNPCADFVGYRDFVLAKLPQIITLDSKEITKSERIRAVQCFAQIEPKIIKAQEKYRILRAEQIERSKWNLNNTNLSDEEFWKASSEHSPESRLEISRRSRKSKNLDVKECPPPKQVTYFSKTGRPLNINQAKLSFVFNDGDPTKFTLDLAIYKYLDTNLVEVDLQPIYARICVKGKIFQFVLPEEILIDASTAKRSQTTGHLLLEMPKANYRPLKKNVGAKLKLPIQEKDCKKSVFLEVDEKAQVDVTKIVENNEKRQKFEDNPQVPSLEYSY